MLIARHRPRRLSRACAFAALLILALLVPMIASADNAPPAEILSNYENTTGSTLDRDCGWSAPLSANKDLWFFCDTIVYNSSSQIVEAILGVNTVAEGPYTPGLVPSGISELATPPHTPTIPNNNISQPFLPVPTGLVLPDSSTPCTGNSNGVYPPSFSGSYPASWFSGVTQEPSSSKLMITTNDYCVDGADTSDPFADEGWSAREYTPSTNTLGSPVRVFTTTGGQTLPVQEQLWSPIYYNSYLYLYSFVCDTSAYGVCETGRVFLARVPAASWNQASQYKWWTGSTWGAYGSAQTVITSVTPLGISVGNYTALGKGYLAVVETDVAGDFEVYQAAAPTGPWTPLQSGKVPSACTGGEYGCYALVGHPELSNSSKLLISYYDPAGLGHLHIAAFPWGG